MHQLVFFTVQGGPEGEVRKFVMICITRTELSLSLSRLKVAKPKLIDRELFLVIHITTTYNCLT